MDPSTVEAVGTAIAAATSAVMRSWALVRVHRQRAWEEAQCDHLHCLPPGSRVIDLGEHRLVIEVGGDTGREPSPDVQR